MALLIAEKILNSTLGINDLLQLYMGRNSMLNAAFKNLIVCHLHPYGGFFQNPVTYFKLQ